MFIGYFLIVRSTFARAPFVAIPLVAGLLIAFGALLLRLHGMAFGAPSGDVAPGKASYLPIAAHLGLVLMAGIFLPPPLALPFQNVPNVLPLGGRETFRPQRFAC